MSSNKADSIIAKEWEYIDPTPDIHMLFLQFNERFFYGKLAGVEVKWSPRMTLCAGVCSYEGRGGLCSVRLSAPLLKLRPRKDLVETLLHEMIHAYLFVTERNRDRDGHGPQFQSHMHRINRECGCNITVYHSFHEEVKLYQQHVWRCDGPCCLRRPFYGLVRRSMNRAPGKNDTWWAEHQASCGGKFSKIQEPEGFSQKKSKAAAAKENKNGDIRKFVGKGKVLGGLGGAEKAPGSTTAGPSGGNSFPVAAPTSAGVANIQGFGGTSSGLPTNRVDVPGNVRGFGGLGTGRPAGPLGRGNVVGRGRGGVRGAAANRGGNTLVVTGSQGKPKEAASATETQAGFVPFQGTGFVLGKATATKTNNPSSKMVNNNQVGSGNIRSYGEPSTSKTTSVNNTSSNNNSNKNLKSNDENSKNKNKSPPLTKWFSPTKKDSGTVNNINSNANPCKKLKINDELSKNKEDKSPPLTKWFSPTKKDGGTASTSSSQEKVDDVILVEDPLVKCPVCDCSLPGQSVNSHLDECLSRLSVEDAEVTTIVIDDEDEEEGDLAKCPLCDAYYPAATIEAHVNACVQTLHDAFEADEIAEQADSQADEEEPVKCPVCQANVGAENINAHLDSCLSESVIRSEQAEIGV